MEMVTLLHCTHSVHHLVGGQKLVVVQPHSLVFFTAWTEEQLHVSPLSTVGVRDATHQGTAVGGGGEVGGAHGRG